MYNPDRVFPLGEYILEILYARNLTPEWLQAVTGIPEHDLHEIILGSIPISIDIAAKLERALNIDQTFWLNLEKSWSDYRSQ